MRSFLSVVLIVLAAVLVPLGAIAAWVKTEIGDSDRYVATMAPLARDEAVRGEVITKVTDAIMKNIDVGPLQDSVAALTGGAVRSFTATSAFQGVWNTANRAAHASVVSALTKNGGGNDVRIDLAPAIEQVKRQLVAQGVPFANRIPVEHTDLTVVESTKLGPVRTAFRLLRRIGIWGAVGCLAAAAGAVLVAVRRRRALVGVGLGLAVGAVVLRVLVAIGRKFTLDGLPTDSDPSAAGAVYDALTDFLSTAAWVVLGLGLALALGAWLTGRPWQRGRRAAEAPRPGPAPAE
ncbi:hypothetical protein [Streptomyces sp. SID1034]|uniref:hypothetical protein n=1 Tax=Streptomyces sp. SID1034 TaxID=2690248 RepID=UPI001368EBA1|nr:hypothetical protein [Streptomyces sp. SID1034]